MRRAAFLPNVLRRMSLKASCRLRIMSWWMARAPRHINTHVSIALSRTVTFEKTSCCNSVGRHAQGNLSATPAHEHQYQLTARWPLAPQPALFGLPIALYKGAWIPYDLGHSFALCLLGLT
jgi:hypothetical protein